MFSEVRSAPVPWPMLAGTGKAGVGAALVALSIVVVVDLRARRTRCRARPATCRYRWTASLPGRTRAGRIRWGNAAGRSVAGTSARSARTTPTRRQRAGSCDRAGPTSWAATCSGRSAASGTRTGADGGARSLPTTPPSSCSPTTPTTRSRCKAARPSTSSPTASTPRLSRPGRRPATGGSTSQAARRPCARRSRRGASTSSSSTSPPPPPITVTPVLVADLLAEGEPMPLYVHVIDHPDGRVLVDTGMTEEHPAVRAALDPRLYPLGGQEDFDLAGIDIVVNTHLHADHCGGNHLFAGRPIYVQRRELDDARSEDDYIREWVDAPGVRYAPVDGELELLPGLRLVPAPGHTRGSQVVVVETGGRPVVVGGGGGGGGRGVRG